MNGKRLQELRVKKFGPSNIRWTERQETVTKDQAKQYFDSLFPGYEANIGTRNFPAGIGVAIKRGQDDVAFECAVDQYVIDPDKLPVAILMDLRDTLRETLSELETA